MIKIKEKDTDYYSLRFSGEQFFDKSECIELDHTIEVPDGFKFYQSWGRRDLKAAFKTELKNFFALCGHRGMGDAMFTTSNFLCGSSQNRLVGACIYNFIRAGSLGLLYISNLCIKPEN
jgi:hypothetical protein